MNPKSILWLDNDPGYIYPLIVALKKSGFLVTEARSVTEAKRLLDGGSRFDLVLLDVMIPVSPAERAAGYDANTTDDSHATGLEFYRRYREQLESTGLVVALTVRVDQAIRDQFLSAGLPPAQFVTKLEVRESPVFIAAVKRFLADVNVEGAG